jgi:hypothetical protein
MASPFCTAGDTIGGLLLLLRAVRELRDELARDDDVRDELLCFDDEEEFDDFDEFDEPLSAGQWRGSPPSLPICLALPMMLLMCGK